MGTSPDAVRALLLDIEGTTTPKAFVYDVLFPYARKGIPAFLEAVDSDDPDVLALWKEHAADVRHGLDPPPWRGEDAASLRASAKAYLGWLMDRDRKSTALKAVQGRIWKAGYLSGALKGRVYADVPHAFIRWERQGRRVAIFSSGSVLGQRLLFEHSDAGDLTRFLSAYFDTTIGAKTDPESYGRIARALALVPSEILFVSDTQAEIDAATQQGMVTAHCARDTDTTSLHHPVVRSFDEVCPEASVSPSP